MREEPGPGIPAQASTKTKTMTRNLLPALLLALTVLPATAKDYKYAHDFPGHFVYQEYMPEELHHPTLWQPQENPSEARMRERMEHLWGKKSDPQ